MVYVNGQKFACESCIKGHRSSACHHSDRPLFSIKKKGRPLSQCEKCRELRQSRKFHSKCDCSYKDEGGTTSRLLTSSTKARRFIPILPALPNGLRDILEAARPSDAAPADARQRVDSLLNPCNCGGVWKCNCQASTSAPRGAGSLPDTTLATVARSVEMRRKGDTTTRTFPESSSRADKQIQNGRWETSPPGTSPNGNHKRLKQNYGLRPTPQPLGPDLPPILCTASSSQVQHVEPFPSFPTMPPMSTITSLAGSGCTCGLQCSCPGCVEHRGSDNVAKDRKSCAEGCGTCVDHEMGIALPVPGNKASTSIIDQFFARAAALPAPPTNRTGVQLDPTNMVVYPRKTTERGAAYGLVNLPKLKCCGGQCGCAKGRCGCGKSCDGCCSLHGGEVAADETENVSVSVTRHLSVDTDGQSLSQSPPIEPVIKSCCAKKVGATAA